MTQERIADSWIELEQFRLLVLRTAWLIGKYQDYERARKDIAAVKIAMPRCSFMTWFNERCTCGYWSARRLR